MPINGTQPHLVIFLEPLSLKSVRKTQDTECTGKDY
jgi:hypothetical protein